MIPTTNPSAGPGEAHWETHLDRVGIVHSGIQEENGGPLIVFRDPDNIQLELWAFDWDLVELRPVVRPEPNQGDAP